MEKIKTQAPVDLPNQNLQAFLKAARCGLGVGDLGATAIGTPRLLASKSFSSFLSSVPVRCSQQGWLMGHMLFLDFDHLLVVSSFTLSPHWTFCFG
jgi:hypothetical protein